MASSPSPIFDLAVIGGGVNGVGIARDAAGRGLKVCVIERDDLASGTSQWSTKLVHGGLRYLEHYAFRLVREALIEREVLLGMAPHIIRPLRFVLPHDEGQRPAWMLRAGLFLYDHLGGREVLPSSTSVDLTTDAAGAPLVERLTRGFEYSDCWVEDARLVVLNAMDARERGVDIRTRMSCLAARVVDGLWHLAIRTADGAMTESIAARGLVVAAGPWVGQVVQGVLGANTSAPVRLVKGSHIVLPRLFDHDRAYIFQNPDGRIVFAIPYEHDFTLVGTTDEEYTGDPATPAISDKETDYLIASMNRNFRRQVTRADIVWTYAGIRPLYDDGASAAKDATRDYVLDVSTSEGAPRLTVYGGKITTYRRLAEHAMEKLAPHFPSVGKAWTAGATLPGGDFPVLSFAGLVADFQRAYPFLDHAHAVRLCRLYGTRAVRVLSGAARMEDLGRSYGAGLTDAEVDYLVAQEFARTAHDILWRRTKLGLRLSRDQASALAERLGG